MIDYPALLAHSETAVLRDPKDLGRCLVTGAAGFLGRNLVKGLLAQGCEVRALVHRAPLALEDPKLELVSASVADRKALRRACEGVSTVFHSAAKIALLGGPSASDRYYHAAYETNVIGTRNLLAAAVEAGAERFVHTSSVDVCFDYGHQPALTEEAPYSRSRRSVYQQTKILSEQEVLAANGRDGLSTCAIRPGGIYGPEQNVMLDRFVEQLVRGLLLARIGDGSSRWDVSEVSNLVHGEILAALHLGHRGDGRAGVANGQAYFVNDGEPVNAFEFFRPIVEALGHRLPDRWVPGEVVLPFLFVLERVVLALGLEEPELSPHAIRKLVHTHWASIAKARRELGYVPPKTVTMAVAECIPYCRKLAESLRSHRA